VIVGVLSSAFLPSESLPAVIGLVSTAAMALITMLSGITSSKEKEEKPEIMIINSLIKNLEEAREPMSVTIDGEKVVVQKGMTSISTKK
jgi:formiminotetrahydrofolate cyclodeaminase